VRCNSLRLPISGLLHRRPIPDFFLLSDSVIVTTLHNREAWLITVVHDQPTWDDHRAVLCAALPILTVYDAYFLVFNEKHDNVRGKTCKQNYDAVEILVTFHISRMNKLEMAKFGNHVTNFTHHHGVLVAINE